MISIYKTNVVWKAQDIYFFANKCKAPMASNSFLEQSLRKNFWQSNFQID